MVPCTEPSTFTDGADMAALPLWDFIERDQQLIFKMDDGLRHLVASIDRSPVCLYLNICPLFQLMADESWFTLLLFLRPQLYVTFFSLGWLPFTAGVSIFLIDFNHR